MAWDMVQDDLPPLAVEVQLMLKENGAGG